MIGLNGRPVCGPCAARLPVESLTPPPRPYVRRQPRDPLTMLIAFKACIETHSLPLPGSDMHTRLLDAIADIEDPP